MQALRKIEITRMTQEGMTAEQIYENLTARGMELKKGVATVLRLQSAWKLTHDEKRWVENFRHQCHKQAKAQQIQEFRDIAKDLEIEDFGVWLEAQVNEQSARVARHELALKLMGEHAPKNPERRKLQQHGRKKDKSMGGAGSGSGSDDDDDIEDENDDKVVVDANIDQQVGEGDEVPVADMDGDTIMVGGSEPGPAAPKSATRSSARPSKGKAIALVDPSLVPFTPPTAAMTGDDAAPAKDESQSTPAPAKRGRGRPKRDKSASAAEAAQDAGATPAGPSSQRAAASTTPRASTSRRSRGLTAATEATPPAEQVGTPMSSLVLRPEEAEANKSTLTTLEQYNAAAQEYKELLQARTENKAAPGSLTGLPPSSKQVEAAKKKLKDLTQAMMNDLA